MCAKYATPFWYQDESIFKRGKFRHKEFLCQCERQFEKSKELFTRHYKNNYDTPHLPPGWMLIEITTLGTWSRLYQELADHRDKQEIAARFGLPKVIMESWIHSLSYVRNICAHHGRLWNRVLGVSPKQMRGASPNSLTAEDRFSAVAYMIHHLLMTINNENKWIHDFRTLASGFGDQRHFNMGFKSDWQADPFWGL
ncbi:Abi family protein [Alkalidesulfovibrio alkalitolerans DSM 16529]|uniref:Abi family protein n=1 Tax=Alkalidesulfovibrio alkalitolerans DSM 16529 TaxID=1121439 RepID=S7T746_9BACT|nr:Abi family protein [Alkalidesulfovibrio alkalitolerans]EPR32932.1 Abi family protein [Alkalidesulfovibrio alkalitolerans DSM 16529]